MKTTNFDSLLKRIERLEQKQQHKQTIFTLPDGTQYEIRTNRLLKVIAGAIYNNERNADTNALSSAVACNSGKLHQLYQMVMGNEAD